LYEEGVEFTMEAGVVLVTEGGVALVTEEGVTVRVTVEDGVLNTSKLDSTLGGGVDLSAQLDVGGAVGGALGCTILTVFSLNDFFMTDVVMILSSSADGGDGLLSS
jgi:hypothetical protein